MTFTLHPQLAKDCVPVCDLSLCRVLLMNNSHFPWLILVPMRAGLRELFDLNQLDYQQAYAEIHQVATHFSTATDAYKMNIACLGNMVEQLHIHIIARYPHDKAWPQPVWNASIIPEPYEKDALKQVTAKWKKMLLP